MNRCMDMADQKGHYEFDFMPIGQAIKKAREAKRMTREQLAGIIGYAPRHIQAIENEGQYPSVELLVQLATMFDISLDQFIFPERPGHRSDARRRIDRALDTLNERDLMVIEATANSLKSSCE